MFLLNNFSIIMLGVFILVGIEAYFDYKERLRWNANGKYSWAKMDCIVYQIMLQIAKMGT